MSSKDIVICSLIVSFFCCVRIESATDGNQSFAQIISAQFPDVYHECGISKSCIATPEGCIKSVSCTMMTTYRKVSYHLDIEIYGRISDNEYVAVGFSTDAKMGKDSVIECVKNSGTLRTYQSYNLPGDTNQRLKSELPGFEPSSLHYVNGYIYCRVQHPITFNNNGENFDLNKPNFLLMATGTARSGNINVHREKESSSSSLILVSPTPTISHFNESRILKQLHGSFMVIAWLIAASIGILIPGHMKAVWEGKKIFGNDHWFLYHQVLMGFTWILTITAFIIIFIDVDGWVSEPASQNPHPVLGCITTVLAFIQPLMAAMRPTPDAPNRYIFNWAHLLVGHSAHILAITTIFLAVGMNEARLQYGTYGVLAMHLCFYVAAQIALTFRSQLKSMVGSLFKKEFPNNPEEKSFEKKSILVVYSSAVVVLGVTVIILIAKG